MSQPPFSPLYLYPFEVKAHRGMTMWVEPHGV